MRIVEEASVEDGIFQGTGPVQSLSSLLDEVQRLSQIPYEMVSSFLRK